MNPVHPASMVSTAMVLMRKAPEAPSVLPGLNPNQPKARMKQPVRTITMSCPGMAFEEPSRLYLPMRGPTIKAKASAVMTTNRRAPPRTRQSQRSRRPIRSWLPAWKAIRRPTPSWRTWDK